MEAGKKQLILTGAIILALGVAGEAVLRIAHVQYDTSLYTGDPQRDGGVIHTGDARCYQMLQIHHICDTAVGCRGLARPSHGTGSGFFWRGIRVFLARDQVFFWPLLDLTPPGCDAWLTRLSRRSEWTARRGDPLIDWFLSRCSRSWRHD